MKYYLGIDGGGTKTKFVLGCEDVSVIGEYTGPTSHYMQCGFDGLEELIRKGILAVCRDASEKNGIDVIPGDIAFAFAGCAGVGDLVADWPKLMETYGAAFNSPEFGPHGIPFEIGNDCENALAGALDGQPGINIIAGTGAIGSGRDASGKFMRCGGWHHALGGDEGSAYWIGWSLLKEYSRQSDGRDEKTALYDAVNRALDLKSDDEMVTRVITEWNIDRTKIAALAPVCSQLAEDGDPAATKIMLSAADELAALAITLKGQLNFGNASDGDPDDGGSDSSDCTGFGSVDSDNALSDSSVLVSGTGGVFKSGPVFTNAFVRLLEENGMKFVAPKYPPDIGSLLLAIQKSRK